jgi:hypothetical protein
MPKTPRKPSYLLHRATGQARVRIDGADHYLGAFGSAESHAKFDALVDDWLRRKTVDRATLTIDELALRFLEHAISYYVTDGQPTSEVACIRAACKAVRQYAGGWVRSAPIEGRSR